MTGYPAIQRVGNRCREKNDQCHGEKSPRQCIENYRHQKEPQQGQQVRQVHDREARQGGGGCQEQLGTIQLQTIGRSFADGTPTDYNQGSIGSVLNLKSGE